MRIVAVEPLSSLTPEERAVADGILARRPFVPDRRTPEVFSLERESRTNRVVAPADGDAAVGADVEHFGDLHTDVPTISQIRTRHAGRHGRRGAPRSRPADPHAATSRRQTTAAATSSSATASAAALPVTCAKGTAPIARAHPAT